MIPSLSLSSLQHLASRAALCLVSKPVFGAVKPTFLKLYWINEGINSAQLVPPDGNKFSFFPQEVNYSLPSAPRWIPLVYPILNLESFC